MRLARVKRQLGEEAARVGIERRILNRFEALRQPCQLVKRDGGAGGYAATVPG
jgi:hypothetical protein